MVQASELRVGNRFIWERPSERGLDYDTEFILTEYWMGEIFSSTIGIAFQDLHPIRLTPEILQKYGFEPVPRFSIMNSYTKSIGRERYLNVSCVGTANEIVSIYEGRPPVINHIIIVRNYDYDGETYLHQLQNIHLVFAHAELTIDETKLPKENITHG